MNNILQYKKTIRTYMRSLRNSLSLSEKNIASQLITNKIINLKDIKQSTHIAIFMSIDGEISTSLLIKSLLLMNKKIYLPIVTMDSFRKLSFAQYTRFTPLVYNRLHIYEPKYNINSLIPLEHLDIIFIPLVAFDKYGNRLGMGGGYYDRTLQNVNQNFNPTIIGLAYDFQKISLRILPTEKWDKKIPKIITPFSSYCWNNQNNH